MPNRNRGGRRIEGDVDILGEGPLEKIEGEGALQNVEGEETQ